MSRHGPAPIARVAADAREQVGSLGVLVTLLTLDAHLVLANAGWPAPGLAAYAAPLDHSICRHTSAMRATLAIEDTHAHPLLRGTPAAEETGVAAYLGVPVFVGPGAAATICAINDTRRGWSAADVACMEQAARRAAMALLPDVVRPPDKLPLIVPAARTA